MFQLCCLLAVAVVVNGNICCLPEQYEFTAFIVSDPVLDEVDERTRMIMQEQPSVSVDRTERRIYTETDLNIDGHEMKIASLLLYNKKVQYTIANGTCTVSDLEVWNQPDCVPDNATRVSTGILGLGQPLHFTEYSWKILNQSTSIYVGLTDECVPVYAKSFNTEGTVVSGAIFANITLAIANPAVFDIPEVCKSAEMV